MKEAAAEALPAAALQGLMARLPHRFARPDLLQRALTHRSFCAQHNERLEFLGDAVLGLAVSALLCEKLPRASEGELSRLRANLVRQDSLHRMAQDLGLGECLRLGEGELRSGGRTRASILADALEALIGAVYLDAGYNAAQALVHTLLQDRDIRADAPAVHKDPKTALQECLQARRLPLPQYSVLQAQGLAHQQTFVVECQIKALQQRYQGQGTSRRAAEQAAAAQALCALAQDGKKPPQGG